VIFTVAGLIEMKRIHGCEGWLAVRGCVAPLRTYFQRSERTLRYSTASP